jgi:hypothetical protein
MRTTSDLIAELDQESPKFFVTAIAVGFKTETKFVSSSDSNRQKKLDDLVHAGGEPVGLIGIAVDSEKVSGFSRPFAEYGTQQGHDYLAALLHRFGESLQLSITSSEGWVN